MKRPVTIGVAFATAAVLAGCGSDSSSNDHSTNDSFTSEKVIHLNDGRNVTCLYYYTNGISCDWENAR